MAWNQTGEINSGRHGSREKGIQRGLLCTTKNTPLRCPHLARPTVQWEGPGSCLCVSRQLHPCTQTAGQRSHAVVNAAGQRRSTVNGQRTTDVSDCGAAACFISHSSSAAASCSAMTDLRHAVQQSTVYGIVHDVRHGWQAGNGASRGGAGRLSTCPET